MSILLEALRKSEKNQHPREVPTIHTGDQADPVRESFRVGPLVLLLIAALCIIGWFVWRQYQQPADGYQPPVTLEKKAGQTVQKPLAESGATTEAAPRNAAGDKPAVRDRTPVESYRAPVTSAPPASSQNTGPATASSSGRPASEASRPGSTFQRLANARNNTATTNPGKAAAATTKPGTEPAATSAAPDQPVTTRPAGTEQPQRDPRETQPISYWELPDAIRESVPEIKFSVLVYAKNPADRFVLINGQRLGEGDTAQPGLVVKEIRLDGVVFSYRLYQFLVER